MTEKESAHPSVRQLCELTAAATVNGVSSKESPLLLQSSMPALASQQTLTDSSNESSARQGDGEEIPRSKSMVSIPQHLNITMDSNVVYVVPFNKH
jgi:hypothetical protein